ncbi:hypothetical protein KF840_15165 [bacterium]|nr:hypothetical protein [bacterium]
MRTWLVAVGLAAALAIPGCLAREVTSARPGAIPTASPEDFNAVALPVYRLVANPPLLDAPSRLLVVQLRITSTGDHSYTVTPGDLTVALPDGTHARIFDTARADQLLRRTHLAEADMSYLLRANHVPGGIATYSSDALAQMVGSNLLAEGTVAPGQPLQGYIVIDTGQPMLSLDGASFEVIARRVGDYAPARYAYQVATAGAATAGAQ